MKADHDIRALAAKFQIRGEFLSAEPYGSGHINDTYRVAINRNGVQVRYILQRINHTVFKNPLAVMENISRVTAHLRTKWAGETDQNRRVLTLIPVRDGLPVYRDHAGHYWRVYLFIEQARTCDTVQSPKQAFEAAKAFGLFQRQLADLPAPRLHDTIPDFHHTPKRFAALERAIEADALNRAVEARTEIQFASRRKAIAGVLLDAHLPERVTHNDTKFSNVMLDDSTGEGICVVDLDTVMPGLALYDFGDMVRATTSPVKEDERDLSQVRMQFPMFEALVRGYLASVDSVLTKGEKQYLAFSGKLIAFETGLRFLTDFLSGDAYFKIHRQNQNLDRCRTQFKLVESIETQEERMTRFVESIECGEASLERMAESSK